MATASYRSAGAMYVCAPTNHFEDISALLDVIKKYKQLGGKLPPEIETALEVAKAGKNVEDSLNLACEGLFKFYVSETVRCAKDAGFSSVSQYQSERMTDPDGGRVWKHEDCILRVERAWQLHNINYSINPLNPESALRQFLGKTADQVMSIVAKHVKKAAKKRIESGSPRVKKKQ